MPFPNEHAARLKDPSQYVRFRRENDKFGTGIHAVWGIKRDQTTELQAIRFDAKKFTAEEAKKWLKDHDQKAILFEKATGDDNKKGDEGEMSTRVVRMPPLSLRADLAPRTINEEDRSVELIFTTGAAVKRRDWWTGKEYVEVLSLDPAHVRLERLNNGAPLLDSHRPYSVADQLGAVIPGSVELMKKAAVGRVRFSRRQEVEAVWQDVKDGLVRNVSIGYRIHKFEEKPGKGEDTPPIRTAVDWEPFEVSMVPIPADAGAKVRAGEVDDANECEIVATAEAAGATQLSERTRVAGDATIQEDVMAEETRSEEFRADMSLTPPPPPKPAPEPTDQQRGAEAERKRVAGIRKACLNAGCSRALESELIEKGTSLEEAQTRVLEWVGAQNHNDVPRQVSRPSGHDVTVGEDPFIHTREGIENALLHKAHPWTKDANGREVGFKLSDKGREYRGLNLIRLAERYLIKQGIRTEGLSPMEVAGIALGLTSRSGMHTTSDFSLLLADVAGKTLRAAYNEAPQTFAPITRAATARDFKPMKRNQLGEAPQLQLVLEHGEIPAGTIGEAKEQYSLATYAVRFAITRQALINDDLDAFSRLPLMFGRQARNKESDLVWAQITDNPNMGDGVALFHANHGNLAGSGGAIDVTTISAGRSAMRVQEGVDGATKLNIIPRYLIVPAAKETVADQFVSVNLLASQPSSVNPFSGRLTVIAEPRLDGVSASAWYLSAAIADGQDVLELAMLEGQDGPLVEQEVGFIVDGIQMKVRHDIGAKVIDWRGLYKNAGA